MQIGCATALENTRPAGAQPPCAPAQSLPRHSGARAPVNDGRAINAAAGKLPGFARERGKIVFAYSFPG